MKIFTGTVVAKKMDKTAVVSITRVIVHPVYGKRVKRMKKYQVHDEENNAKPGQIAKFVASKPYSKTKKWKIIELIDSKSVKVTKEKEVKKTKESKVKTAKGGNKK